MSFGSRTSLAVLTGVAIGFSISMTGNVLADRQVEPQLEAMRSAPLPWEDAHLLAEVMERVKREYVDELDDHALMDNAVRGMVSALDPHSAFLDRDEYDEIRASTTGVYPGVGIEVSAEDAGIRVLRPIEGSPADRAGIRAGDYILRIDGQTIGQDLDGAITRMRGRAGTTVRLSVRRDGTSEPLDFTLHRAQVEVHSVERDVLEPGFGYVRITHFSETTAQDMLRAVATLQRQSGHGLRGLVLDLRNNPGGVLEAAVDVSDAFLDDGIIVTADGRTPDARFRMDAAPGDVLGGNPLVVLVNGDSASAAEIVAGALKDHARAKVVGHTTYGKGSVQTVMPLSLGRAIKITTSRYFTPSGASIQEKGVVPDILVAGDEPQGELVPVGSTPRPLVDRDPEIALALRTLKFGRDAPTVVAVAH